MDLDIDPLGRRRWNPVSTRSSFCGHFKHIETLLKRGEMKHEITLFDTMGPNRNVLCPDAPSLCDHIWSHVEIF